MVREQELDELRSIDEPEVRATGRKRLGGRRELTQATTRPNSSWCTLPSSAETSGSPILPSELLTCTFTNGFSAPNSSLLARMSMGGISVTTARPWMCVVVAAMAARR